VVALVAACTTPATPGPTSVEAGFARDMSTHHAQAVELAMLAHEKGSDPEVRQVGADIAMTQQAQIGMMQTWLDGWNLSRNSSQPRMAWMPDGGGELRDVMAGRIVIPELRYGHCIWHVGRAFDFDGRPSRHVFKYLYPMGERPVLGLEWCNRHPEVYVGEGVFDWLALLALELPAFCALGTALPTVGLGFLARARRVYGVFDGDRAGRDAAARYARALPGRCYPLHLPDGCKDLSELLDRADGRDRFVALVGAARCADEPAGDHAPTPAVRAGGRGHHEREEEDDGATEDGRAADAGGEPIGADTHGGERVLAAGDD
jgi:hypothetical protein